MRSLSRLSYIQNTDELSPPCVDLGPDPGDITDENIDDYTGTAFGSISRSNSQMNKGNVQSKVSNQYGLKHPKPQFQRLTSDLFLANNRNMNLGKNTSSIF
jgi:hypothetical protein